MQKLRVELVQLRERLGETVGRQTSFYNYKSVGPDENDGSFAKPEVSITNRGTAINAIAAVGGEFTIFGGVQYGYRK